MAIDLAKMTMNFDRRYALYIQKLYHRPHFTVGLCWNKSLHLQPLQLRYCENSGNTAGACVMRRDYSIMYMQSFHSINGLMAVGRGGNLLCGLSSYLGPTVQNTLIKGHWDSVLLNFEIFILIITLL